MCLHIGKQYYKGSGFIYLLPIANAFEKHVSVRWYAFLHVNCGQLRVSRTADAALSTSNNDVSVRDGEEAVSHLLTSALIWLKIRTDPPDQPTRVGHTSAPTSAPTRMLLDDAKRA